MSPLVELILWVIVLLGLAFKKVSPKIWTAVISVLLTASWIWGNLPFLGFLILAILFVPIAILANRPELRRQWFSDRVFELFRKRLPPMNQTEREALEAGDVWWEAELFQGKPNWNKLRSLPRPALTTEEQAFIDNQVETLCAMVDDWKIVHEYGDMPPEIWNTLKQERFFGIIIPKRYGGLGFSALAHSTIVIKLATRSLCAAVNTMVPNSLGPAELLLHYGTDEQKEHYLPRLAKGEEIPCFALTGPEAGSDAGAIPDTGIVCKGEFEGQAVLGMRLTWDKRYITLAPIATVLGLAFKLYDPEHLLGDKVDIGITVALIKTDQPGVEIGKRHSPLGLPFQNGPTRGKDVFIPLDWVIGGPSMVGKGWRMLMECLSTGRSISLPALATATGKLCYRMTGAYARIRKQFNQPIGKFEGVQEVMGRIAGQTYMIEAARLLTALAVDLGVKPSIVSAIVKYHLSEMGRKIATDALDVHAGRGIIAGPRNYLSLGYQGQSIGITVEGANILTRNLIIFGQGAIRCHPYILREMQATKEEDVEHGMAEFDRALFSHLGYFISNGARAFGYGLTGALLARAPENAGVVASYYRHLTRMSAVLAFTADLAMLMLGGELKRRERLSARLGDALSALYLGSAVLKYFEDNQKETVDLPFVEWSVKTCLMNAQTAIVEFCRNFPNPFVGTLVKWIVFPLGCPYKHPSDLCTQTLALEMLKPSSFRERITRYCFVGKHENDATGRVEIAFRKVLESESAENKLYVAIRDKKIPKKLALEEQIGIALTLKVLSEAEAALLREAYTAYKDALQVDEFSPSAFQKGSELCQKDPELVSSML
ncbi:MAG: acyl-CoA dehydrogenase [Gammaproteobacteria bacterium]|nr:acyl-CoA dehydrogenase [Gammaproteobacteria bacterium]